MLFFYFLCHIKKTDVIEVKTGNKLQIESAIATSTLNINTISKKKNINNNKQPNPSAIRMTYTASRLGKQGLPNGYL